MSDFLHSQQLHKGHPIISGRQTVYVKEMGPFLAKETLKLLEAKKGSEAYKGLFSKSAGMA